MKIKLKNLKQNSYTFAFMKGTIFAKKIDFLISAILEESWYQKVYFLKLHICVYLCTKFQFSSIILTSCRQTPKTPTQLRIRDEEETMFLLPFYYLLLYFECLNSLCTNKGYHCKFWSLSTSE